MRVAYGFDDIRRNEALIHNAEALIVGFSDAVVPGRFLVNAFPSLRYVPSWFPGAGFQVQANKWRDELNRLATQPLEEVQAKMAGCALRGISALLNVSLIDRSRAIRLHTIPRICLKLILMKKSQSNGLQLLCLLMARTR